MNNPMETYNKEFEELINSDNFEKRVNEVKIKWSGLRTGKTHYEIIHAIPYILKNTKVEVYIITSPLSGIISQNTVKLKISASENGFVVAENPTEALKLVKQRKKIKVVIYMTNMGAWVSEAAAKFFDTLNKTIGLDKVGISIDEFHTWTVSGKENYPLVIGGGSKLFSGALYTRLSLIAEKSAYTFGITATPNFEAQGLVNTTGNLKYTLVNQMLPARLFAHRMGWMDKIKFYNYTNTVYSLDDTVEQMVALLKRCNDVEKVIKSKRAALWHCGIDVEGTTVMNPDDVIKVFIQNNHFLADGNIGAVLLGDQKYVFDKEGNCSTDGIDEETIYEKINDLNDPLRHLLVKNMAGMGVTLPPLKALFSFRPQNKKSNLGHITEMAAQLLGRTTTPNSGLSEDVLWGEHDGDLRNVPNFIPELNMMDWVLPDTPMWRAAVSRMQTDLGCTIDMVDFKSDTNCQTCGQPWPEGNDVVDIDMLGDDFSTIDTVLKVA